MSEARWVSMRTRSYIIHQKKLADISALNAIHSSCPKRVGRLWCIEVIYPRSHFIDLEATIRYL